MLPKAATEFRPASLTVPLAGWVTRREPGHDVSDSTHGHRDCLAGSWLSFIPYPLARAAAPLSLPWSEPLPSCSLVVDLEQLEAAHWILGQELKLLFLRTEPTAPLCPIVHFKN
jgi:hypothetical protein